MRQVGMSKLTIKQHWLQKVLGQDLNFPASLTSFSLLVPITVLLIPTLTYCQNDPDTQAQTQPISVFPLQTYSSVYSLKFRRSLFCAFAYSTMSLAHCTSLPVPVFLDSLLRGSPHIFLVFLFVCFCFLIITLPIKRSSSVPTVFNTHCWVELRLDINV